MIASLRLLLLFLTHFYSTLSDFSTNLILTILSSLKSKNPEVQELGKSCFNICIKKENFLQIFCLQIRIELNQSNLPGFSSLVDAAWKILDQKPDFKSSFLFENDPFPLFSKSETQEAAISLVPLIMYSTPQFSTKDNSLKYIKEITHFVSKKSSLRPLTFISLGRFLFHANLNFDLTSLKKLTSKFSFFDSDESIFCFLAFLRFQNPEYRNQITKVFERPATPLIIEGLQVLLDIVPDLRSIIHQTIFPNWLYFTCSIAIK